MQHLSTNRRKKRSDNNYVAIGYQLESSMKRADFNALVLADDQGFVMARAGNPDTCEEMAALSPCLSANARAWHGFIDTKAGKSLLTVYPITVNNQQLYLTASEGRRAHLIAEEMHRSNQGIRRILL